MTTVVIAVLLEIPLVYYFAVGIAGIVYISFVVYEDWKDLRRVKEEASRTRGERRSPTQARSATGSAGVTDWTG